MTFRMGRMTNEEKHFMTINANNMSVEEIAEKLNREASSVRKTMNHMGLKLEAVEQYIDHAEYDIKKRPYWAILEQQFSKQELELLVYEWARMVSQFQDEVLPTEELQILDALKLEILMSRALIDQQQSSNDIVELATAIEAEKRLPPENRDTDLLLSLEQRITFARNAQTAFGRDYREYLDKKKQILKELKATRADRIKRVENAKESFHSWMGMLISDPDKRRRLGLQMEKMRKAVEAEAHRLAQFHQYENKEIDRPYLTPETVTDDDSVDAAVRDYQTGGKYDSGRPNESV